MKFGQIFILLFLYCAIGFPLSEATAEESLYIRYYIGIDGDAISSLSEEDKSAYDGIMFPIYIGYVSFYPDNTIKFTKKTDLAIINIVKFFADIEKDNKIKVSYYGGGYATEARMKPGMRFEAYPNDPQYSDIILDEMRLEGMSTIKAEISDVPPDENFAPKFSETCVYKYKGTSYKDSCPSSGKSLSKLWIQDKKK